MSSPWMPLYIGDYLKDTRRLSTVEHGAYMLLIMDYWSNGGLPDDDRKLARIAGLPEVEWLAIRETIAELFLPGWRHKRIDDELQKSAEKSNKAKASAEKRWSGKPENANAMRTHIEGTANAHANAVLSQSQSQDNTLSCEPTPVAAYTKSIADVYTIAGQACPDLYPAHRWLKAGWPIELVCELIRAKLAANPGKPFKLQYFENAIADAVARANAPVPIGSPPNQRAGPRPNAPNKPPSIFAQLSKNYREGQTNEPRSEVPSLLIDAKPTASGFG